MMKKLLIANRGEIAVRILQAARELSPPVHTVALSTPNDTSHCQLGHPDQTITLPSAASYLDISLVVKICQEHGIDTVHPGYGFLSESAEFARRMHEIGVTVIGPGAEILERTGDKLQAKALAASCGVPVLPSHSAQSLDEIRAFVEKVGYPVMIKAVDGGGGRGIRLIHQHQASELANLVARARSESHSQTVFVEKAAVDGFHHVEVQVLGDGTGTVHHLHERDCSVQRRFQKIVECAPSLLDRSIINRVIEAALRIARTIHYRSLGTFEFLVSESRPEFYFLEINPRLQVEHTVTEAVTGVDLVQAQLRTIHPAPSLRRRPQRQLRAEHRQNHRLLRGPGHGVRVDSHLVPPVTVASDFDNLLAKIIVTASSWESAVRKARRVLSDTRIEGVKTNLPLLRGIVATEDFLEGRIDTQWLERNLPAVLGTGERISASLVSVHHQKPARPGLQLPTSSSLLFRRGDAWSISLSPLALSPTSKEETGEIRQHLRLSRVLRNDFPSSLTAEIEYTTPSASIPYKLHLSATGAATAASALVSGHRRGDPSNPRHIVLPLSGKLIEVLVKPGETIAKDQVVAFVKQMKMELEVRSPRAGRVKWVFEVRRDGEEEDVVEGMLLVELDTVSVSVAEKGKL
ncbi:putative pyruvate carboxylase [Aspergillus novofumigatus IBT 16806]|uniref:Carboxylase:pyruvate/acetyl-coa/propionyl-CoA n=1 Tax=Aspergillus novofumigatus (strain IBT 16806) TaxID=1392255 RepID=A0A2I1CHB3_ASPN1|nr:carboxylase:pyruvate/acetyl-coa/propionyl-CoA [Aspergillus novofumigatus IBT 16806]PKX97013.1 carboxylase:pyruvate/acetyl-coa/propionyl-CoA [Aspergillus novofumigatus IBT 16806]